MRSVLRGVLLLLLLVPPPPSRPFAVGWSPSLSPQVDLLDFSNQNDARDEEYPPSCSCHCKYITINRRRERSSESLPRLASSDSTPIMVVAASVAGLAFPRPFNNETSIAACDIALPSSFWLMPPPAPQSLLLSTSTRRLPLLPPTDENAFCLARLSASLPCL